MSINPYESSPLSADTNDRPLRSSVELALTGLATVAVAANYLTATQLPFPDPSAFTDIVFCTLPIAVAVNVRYLCVGEIQGRYLRFAAWLVPLVITVALLACLTPHFVPDYFGVAAFLSGNYFFGPYGVFPWGWWLLCGVIGSAMLVRCKAVWIRCLVSMAIFLGYAHNAFAAWLLSHTLISP